VPESPDLVVCGGGAAGIAAALAAARLGARVELVEAGERVGGTMAGALLHTLAGLYDSAGDLINAGLVAELVDRLSRASGGAATRRRMGRVFVQSVDPNLYREVVEAWLVEEPKLAVSVGTLASRPRRSGSRIDAVLLTSSAGERTATPRAIVDATGEAAVFRALGPEYLLPPGPAVAAGFVIRLRGVDKAAIKFPRNVGVAREIRQWVARGTLPADCDGAWLDVGIYEDEAFVKLAVKRPDEPHTHERLSAAARELARQLSALEGFEAVTVSQLSAIGFRENGRARGEYCLTEADVRTGARFEDVACRCAWPIEHWDAERGLTLEYLEDGASYDIPLRALKAASIENLWVAGKCLSAEPRAQASARCVGTCWAMGEAVARAASAFLESAPLH